MTTVKLNDEQLNLVLLGLRTAAWVSRNEKMDTQANEFSGLADAIAAYRGNADEPSDSQTDR
jgi:hypothetical protein